MADLSLFNWTKQETSKYHFERFRLETNLTLAAQWQAQLKYLPLSAQSDKALYLEKIPFPPEGFRLEIGQGKLRLLAGDDAGFYYGLAALKLMLAMTAGILPGGIVEEIPDYPNRGVMLDVSRGKLPTLDYLKQLVGVLSDMRYNILQLYCEDKLELKGHPLLGAITGVYTQSEIVELDQYCLAHFVQLQPCIQTYSHMHGILRTPGYSDLSENTDLFSFGAGNEKVYAFLEEEFTQVLPWFTSKTVNINMDEAYDLGTGYSKEAVQRQGKGAVFLQHILRVIAAAEKGGATKIQLWGDIVQKYPELLSQLPDNVIVMEWNYNPLPKFESLSLFGSLGREFWAAGGVGTWNSIFPRTYNCYINLTNLYAQALEAGAKGFLVTDWGDYGHMQPLGLSLYGYLIGAAQRRGRPDVTPGELEEKLWPLMLPTEQMRTGFRALMDSNLAQNLKTDFKTMSIYYFFDDMLDGLSMRGNAQYPKLTEQTFWELSRCGELACESFGAEAALAVETRKYPDPNWEVLFGQTYLRELRLSAGMTKFIGEKGLLACRILSDLNREDLTPEDIMQMIFSIHQLYDTFCQLRREFENVWMLRARHQGIQTSLSLFDHAGVQMAQTVRWLARQRERLLRGEQVDRTLQTYCGKDYEVLWTADFKNMWDRAYPWR